MPPNKESDDDSINNQILWFPHNDDAIRKRKKFHYGNMCVQCYMYSERENFMAIIHNF
jgi:hypothetical protein